MIGKMGGGRGEGRGLDPAEAEEADSIWRRWDQMIRIRLDWIGSDLVGVIGFRWQQWRRRRRSRRGCKEKGKKGRKESR